MKQYLELVMTFFLIIIILSGCTEKKTENNGDESTGNPDTDRFIGTWENSSGYPQSITFYTNGSCYSPSLGWHSNWEIEEGIVIVGDLESLNYKYYYTFTDDNTLNLAPYPTETFFVYLKQ